MRRVLVIAAVVLLTLTGCTDIRAPTQRAAPTSDTATPSTQTTSPPPPVPPSPTATPQITPAYSAHRTGPGCGRTAATTPASALTARIGDIDGDGRADIEWAYMRDGSGTLYFGVSTASHATIGTSQEFASGADRRVVIARLRNSAVIALPADRHGIPLHTFARCSFHRPIGVNGKPYEFDQGDFQADGLGAACLNGRLVGLQSPRRGNIHALTATTVIVSPDGRTAANGATVTLYANADQHPTADQNAQNPTCGSNAVLIIR